jgi:hypothetical protein
MALTKPDMLGEQSVMSTTATSFYTTGGTLRQVGAGGAEGGGTHEVGRWGAGPRAS